MATAALSCERPLPTETAKRIVGYRIEGQVTDHFKRTLPEVEVRMFYYFEYANSSTPPHRGIHVSQNLALVTVQLYSANNQLLGILFQQNVPVGDFEYLWTGRNGSGDLVASGVYYVKYILGSADTVNTYVVGVSGGRVATTDADGKYQIPQERLPIGFAPVPVYFDDGSFDANYRIGSRVRLEFLWQGYTFPFLFDVEMNAVTNGTVSLN
jgi:hypothetical protein